MPKPTWVMPSIGNLMVHVFSSKTIPARGKTPDGDEFSTYEFNPTMLAEQARHIRGVYRLDDLHWY